MSKQESNDLQELGEYLFNRYHQGKFIFEARRQEEFENQSAGVRLRNQMKKVARWAKDARSNSRREMDSPGNDDWSYLITGVNMTTNAPPHIRRAPGWAKGPILEQTFELDEMVRTLADDARKAQEGNKAAGVRFRKATIRIERLARSIKRDSLAAEKACYADTKDRFRVGNLVKIPWRGGDCSIGLILKVSRQSVTLRYHDPSLNEVSDRRFRKRVVEPIETKKEVA
jgi:hypothetical protein